MAPHLVRRLERKMKLHKYPKKAVPKLSNSQPQCHTPSLNPENRALRGLTVLSQEGLPSRSLNTARLQLASQRLTTRILAPGHFVQPIKRKDLQLSEAVEFWISLVETLANQQEALPPAQAYQQRAAYAGAAKSRYRRYQTLNPKPDYMGTC